MLSFHLLVLLPHVRAQAPVANFSASSTSGCSPLFVQFTDLSTGSPFSWAWDFGNGQIATTQHPTVTYTTPGTYTVRLVVRNTSGIDEEIKTAYITVAPGPTASFSANITTACVPATIQFTDQSTVPAGGGTITSWLWNFGDGNTSTSQNPSYTYTNTGFYNISLTVTSSTGCTSTAAIGRYIRIVDGIDANFSFTEPGTCTSPFIVNFQDQSAGPGNFTYLWDFGNGGGTSTLANPTATYPGPGTYTVTLTVQSDLGCSGTTSQTITISGKTTDFIAPASICVGQTVTFQNNSTPAPITSSWDFGDGTTSSQINPMKIFTAAGTYQVEMINDYGNCRDSITKTVTVIDNPIIDFIANDSTSCSAPFTVQFTDTSPIPGTSWLWDFGDGNTSTQQNPSHTYTAFGDYTVTLTATLAGGCTGTFTKTNYIQIRTVTIGLANAPVGGCIPFTFSPIANIQTVDPIVSYNWDMGEPGGIYNIQNPTHTYNNVGTYTITLSVTTQSGCTQTQSFPGAVMTGTPPVVNFSFAPNNVCASTPVQFTDLSTTTPNATVSWLWLFGDGQSSGEQNPLHQYVDTGRLNVSLIVSNNGCRDTLVQEIVVLPPVAIFDYTVNCNNRREVTFIDQSLADPAFGPVTYEWHMGDPANTILFGAPGPTFTYPALGTYTVTLIVTNGPCSYDTTRQITLADEPATFTINRNPVCRNEPFTLTATGINAANVASYEWDIDGTIFTSTTPSISHSLTANGTYNVSLTVIDLNGCRTTASIPNYITVGGPVADFVPNSGGACINGPVTFTDQSTPAGSINQWTYHFGDGTSQTFTSAPFTHTYALTGTYDVSLVVRDNAGCTDSVFRANAVMITRPIVGFRADTVYCPEIPLQFVDTSFGTGLTYVWDFGDGGTSTLQNPTHAYPAGNGDYTVTLTITDIVGCVSTITKPNYIRIRRPHADFTLQDSTGICLPLVTTFTFQGSDYSSFSWDFGDGGTSNQLNPSHFYNFYGTYTPKLYTYGPGGCVDSADATVIAYDPAAIPITFNPATACNTLTVDFTMTPPPGFSFQFHFGDGQVDSSGNTTLSHFYATPGMFYPSIRLTDRFGCQGSRSVGPITVWGAIPLFGMDKDAMCDQGEVFFINYTVSNDPIVSVNWDFGDGATSTLPDPVSHVYTGAGTYIVRLTVTTQNNCTSSFEDTVRVYPTPSISIIASDTICVNQSAAFQATTAQVDSTIRWNWAFGNGGTSQSQNPSVTYTTPGDYNVQLIATNVLGCADTIDHDLHVVPLPTAVAVTNPLTVISGGSITLAMTYTGPVVSYLWTPSTRLDCTNCPAPVANPQFSTRYQVSITDRYGCRNSGEIMVNVVCTGQNFFVPNTFSPNGDGSNDVFYPRGTGLFSIRTMRIFNRWGEVVFEGRELPVNNPSYGWNGKYKGKNPQADVYVYQLEIVCANGEIIKYSGNIALIL